jgi:hypothetical protein
MRVSFLVMTSAALSLASICGAQPRRVQEYVVVVSDSSPFTDIDGLLAAAKSKQDGLNCGAGHSGSTPGKAACENFGKIIGANLTTIPYKSFKDLVTDLNGRQVDFGVIAADDAKSWIESGMLRVLAVNLDGTSSPFPGKPNRNALTLKALHRASVSLLRQVVGYHHRLPSALRTLSRHICRIPQRVADTLVHSILDILQKDHAQIRTV